MSLHIPKEERPRGILTKRGRMRRPRPSLAGKLEHLQILLGTTYFNRWPLVIRFFVSTAWDEWQKISSQLRADRASVIRNVPTILDLRKSEFNEVGAELQKKRKGAKFDPNGIGGVQGLDTTFGKVPPIYTPPTLL